MDIRDIIRADNDRIFMVDPECFLIFTGGSVDDPQPFIRIGNWMDLPADIIPHIENIIIPDRLLGNPATEQFNIDIDYLPTNRYIGSRGIVKRYLNFQKIFGLDLRNASVVDAEKDIPEISSQKNISDRESFTGIFYSDGNFKIKHGGRDLFDLESAVKNSMNDGAAHEKLCAINRKLEGSGVIISEGNPVFFSKGSLTSYLFPSSYIRSFALAGINPRSITGVIHPSSNFVSLTKFFKWKNSTSGRVAVFTDHISDMTSIKSLFPDATIAASPFAAMKHICPGMTITPVSGSYNVKAVFEGENRISCTFIKSPEKIKESMSGCDLALITYSAFSESSAFFRSGKIPFAIIEDANPSFDRACKTDNIIMFQNAQYSIKSAAREAIEARYSELREKIAPGCDDLDTVEMCGEVLKDFKNRDFADISGAISVLRCVCAFSHVRKAVSKAQNELRDFTAANGTYLKTTSGSRMFSLLVCDATAVMFYDGEIPMEVSPVPEITDDVTTYVFANDGEKEICRKIIADRKRLQNLLALFNRHEQHAKNVARLSDSITKRKNHFKSEIIQESFETGFHKAETIALKGAGILSSLLSKQADEENHIFSEKDFSSEAEINALCDDIASSEYTSNHFKLHPARGLNHLNSIIRNSSFAEAWLGSGKPDIVSLDEKTQNLLKASSRFYGKDYKKLTDREKAAVAQLNRTLIEITHRGSKKYTPKKTLKKKNIAAIIIVAAGIILALIFGGKPVKDTVTKTVMEIKSGKEKGETPVVSSRSISDQKGEFLKIKRDEIETELVKILPKQSHLAGWEYEIFIMANRIALSNGYSPILENQFGKKNPHWIFPGNIFVLPSGLRVSVEKGDTLWAIAERFLSLSTAKFAAAYDKLAKQKKEGETLDKDVLKEAEFWAYMARDRKALKEIAGK